MARIKCPECKEKFEIDMSEYDDGDSLDCEECGAELLIKMDSVGKFSIITPKEKFLDEDEDFDMDDD